MLSANEVSARLERRLPPEDLPEVRYIRSKAVVSRDVAGETIVVPICRGGGDLDSVYILNELGREIWVLLEQSCSVQGLANWVTDRYDVRPEQAFLDVDSYLADLREVGLIHSI
jgi:hypothetical protein